MQQKPLLGALLPCSLVAWALLFASPAFADDEGVIEKQLSEIGSIPNEEIMSVQRKYTRKVMRHELTPVSLGGVPFGTVRRTMTGGAGYSLHFNDWLAGEVNFTYTKNFFSRFTTDINENNPTPDIRPDVQKLLLIGSLGLQFTPFYGKMSTFSRFIAYIEPFFSVGAGLAKTETNNYLTFYPGLGIRVFFREWVSMKFEFRDYMYFEKFVQRTTPHSEATSLRHNFSVAVALSFWLPKMPR